jgi:poly-gamma-glutamate synthesis protein (capsule biosynthesis protein)
MQESPQSLQKNFFHFQEIKNFSPVQASSLKGNILICILRFLYRIITIINGGKWSQPITDFEENPAYTKPNEVLYLGYKYYFRIPFRYPEKIVNHFRNQHLDFTPSSDFISHTKITISAGGDLMPYDRIRKVYCEKLWDEAGDFFFSSDIVFANLETPLIPSLPPSLVPEVMLHDMLFNADEEMFEIFNGNRKYKGYDVLSTANNHSLDMGEDGIKATIEFLKSNHIAYTGTALSQTDRENFPIIERNGIKVAFLAYTYSLNKFLPVSGKEYLVNHLRTNHLQTDITPLTEDVKLAKKRGADFVILSLHSGNAYQVFPSEHTVKMFHRIFRETGVDAILGGHPHNPQPMEKFEFVCPFENYKKHGFAIYSLPDFVAYDIFILDRLIPLLKLHIEKGEIDGKLRTILTSIEVLPIYNWGSKNLKKSKEIRFLDLKKTVRLTETGQMPDFMSKKCVKELHFLNYFYDNYFLPKAKK